MAPNHQSKQIFEILPQSPTPMAHNPAEESPATSTSEESLDSWYQTEGESEPDGRWPSSKQSMLKKKEIHILKGIIDFRSKQKFPVYDYNELIAFVKKFLGFPLTRRYLTAKIQRLKKKYMDIAARFEEEEEITLSKPHDCRVHRLSEKIWGEDDTRVSTHFPEFLSSSHVKAEKKKKKKKKVTCLYPKSNKMVKDELGRKRKSLRIEELEVFVRRMELITEQAKSVLKVHKSQGD